MTKYFDEHPSRSCERTFVNVFLWSRQYPVKWAIVEGAMEMCIRDRQAIAKMKEKINMATDFDKVINRKGTHSLKYDFATVRGKKADILPLWVRCV